MQIPCALLVTPELDALYSGRDVDDLGFVVLLPVERIEISFNPRRILGLVPVHHKTLFSNVGSEGLSHARHGDAAVRTRTSHSRSVVPEQVQLAILLKRHMVNHRCL